MLAAMSGGLLVIQPQDTAASPRIFYWITYLYYFQIISVNNSTHSSGCVVGNLRYCFCHISLIWITIYCWVSGHGRFYNTGSLSRKHMRKWCSYVSGTWKQRNKVTALMTLHWCQPISDLYKCKIKCISLLSSRKNFDKIIIHADRHT